jgi:transposase
MAIHKSEDYKKSAIEYYLIGDSTQEEVCQIFKCTRRSLMRWLDKYRENGEIKRHQRKPIAYKVRKEHVTFLLNEIKQNKTITMNDLLHKLKENFDISLSRYHINRIINDNNITLKLTHIRHEPIQRFGKDININNKLKEFYNTIKNYNLKDIICIDETSVSGLQKRKHCYSNLGKRCIIKTQSQEVFKKYTAIFAISVDGVIGWELYEKRGIDSVRLIEFLRKYITTKYKKKLIILDNASSHRNNDVKNVINKDNILLHSVPYQHFTNSIENYFSMFKSKLNKLEGLKYEDIKQDIHKVLLSINLDIYKNIIKGAYEHDRINKYENKKQPSNRIKIAKNYL